VLYEFILMMMMMMMMRYALVFLLKIENLSKTQCLA